MEAWKKTFGCPLAIAKIAVEGSAKINGGASGEKGGFGGGAVEVAGKLELFGGLLNGSLPLMGFEASESYNQGFAFSITLGGFVVEQVRARCAIEADAGRTSRGIV